MAVLTLNKINCNRNFDEGNQVKISRQSVKGDRIADQFTGTSRLGLRKVFTWTSRQLPEVDILGKKV